MLVCIKSQGVKLNLEQTSHPLVTTPTRTLAFEVLHSKTTSTYMYSQLEEALEVAVSYVQF